MKKLLGKFSFLSARVAAFFFGILFVGVVSATVLNIAQKQDGDRIFAHEFNQILDIVAPFYNDNGKLGIGIAPTEELHVAGDIKATQNILSSNLTSQCTAGQVVQGFGLNGSLVCVPQN